jgi:hypothetical protein
MKSTFFLFFNILLTGIISTNNNKNNFPFRITNKRINILVDMNNQLGTFDEKVTYNLELDNNELKSVKFQKILPDIDALFFDTKVTSNDVKIIKSELVDINNDGVNFNKNKKALNVEFVPLENSDNNFNKNDQGAINIDYFYVTKDMALVEKSKNEFYLKDVNILDESNISTSSNYPTKFSIQIKNMPDNVKMKSIDINNEIIPTNDNTNNNNNYNLKKRSLFSTNSNNSNKEVNVEFNNEKSTDTKIRVLFQKIDSPNYNQNGNGSSTKITSEKKYYYYSDDKAKSHDDKWESIIAILMVICICFLCCCHQSDNKQGYEGGDANHHDNPGHDIY